MKPSEAALAAPTLRDALLSVVTRFRERAASLPPEQTARIQTIDDMSAPCQITAFSFPRVRWHVFVVTHSRTAPDLQFKVHDDTQTWNLFELLEKELEDPLWNDAQQAGDRFLLPSPEPDPTLRSLGEAAFLTIHHNSRVWAAENPDRDWGRHLGRSLLGPKTAMWDFHGLPDEIPWDQLLEDAFSNLNPPAPPVVAPAAPPSTSPAQPQYTGRGAYHYPSIRIGKVPNPRLRNALVARDALPGILVLKEHLGPHELLVTHNGFFGLMTASKEDAIRWLNLLMAAMRQHGCLSRPVHETELGSFHRPDTNSPAHWGGTWPSWGPDRNDPASFTQPWLSDAELAVCLRTAEALATKPYAAKLPWLLEAESHLIDHEMPQSLIFSWAIIEDVMAQRWDAFLTRKQVTGGRRQSLRSTREWPFQARLDALELAGELPRPTYDRLVATKRVRNDAMHGTAFPTRDEAEAALGIAEVVLVGTDPPIRSKLKPTSWHSFV
jgi:hypothetical protein